MNDLRRSAPAVARNCEPILEVMRTVFPDAGFVLETASGTGEHAAFFSRNFPALAWQPSDRFGDESGSIEAWRAEGSAKLAAPVAVDVCEPVWPIDRADVIININMIHIAPWEACQGLMRGAGRLLPPGGLLFLYGPYQIEGRHTAPSNEDFDASLQARDPDWGVRDLADVVAEAETNGITFERKVAMPANNLSVILRRRG
jgi:hypothetical protein